MAVSYTHLDVYKRQLVDNVLGVYEAPLFVAELAAFEVAELFQLIEASDVYKRQVRSLRAENNGRWQAVHHPRQECKAGCLQSAERGPGPVSYTHLAPSPSDPLADIRLSGRQEGARGIAGKGKAEGRPVGHLSLIHI